MGDTLDNALCKNFFATLDTGLINRRPLVTLVEARREVLGFIERFYNIRWLHSALGNLSRADFEKLHRAA